MLVQKPHMRVDNSCSHYQLWLFHLPTADWNPGPVRTFGGEKNRLPLPTIKLSFMQCLSHSPQLYTPSVTPTSNAELCGLRCGSRLICSMGFPNSLTLRRLMSYIYMEHPFLMFLDHTQRRSTVGRTPLDE